MQLLLYTKTVMHLPPSVRDEIHGAFLQIFVLVEGTFKLPWADTLTAPKKGGSEEKLNKADWDRLVDKWQARPHTCRNSIIGKQKIFFPLLELAPARTRSAVHLCWVTMQSSGARTLLHRAHRRHPQSFAHLRARNCAAIYLNFTSMLLRRGAQRPRWAAVGRTVI